MRRIFSLAFLLSPVFAQQSFASDDLFDINFDVPTIQLTTEYSSEFGSFVEGQYANELTYNDLAVFSLGAGEKQFVVGLTYAKILSEHQWLKVSAEHFAQDNSFNFSSGTTGAFIGQNTTGFGYRYIIAPQTLVRSFNLDAYYGNANNGTFSDISFAEGNQLFLDVRNVVGGNFWGTSGGLTLHPFFNTYLRGTLYYDSVQYDAVYNSAQNAQGIGAGINLEQILSSRLTLKLSAENHQPFDLYTVQLDFNIKEDQDRARGLNFGIGASHLTSNILPFSTDNRILLSLNYRWGGTSPTPQMRELMTWAMTSSSGAPELYVMKDETIVP